MIGNANLSLSLQARNLGVIFYDSLTLHPYIKATCKSAFFQLRRRSRICRLLTKSATKSLVHSFISSRLDYCNSALCGLLKVDRNKLQCVQNAAARLVTHTKKHDHVMPVLAELHWLPVQSKILVLTYKALHGLAPQYI